MIKVDETAGSSCKDLRHANERANFQMQKRSLQLKDVEYMPPSHMYAIQDNAEKRPVDTDMAPESIHAGSLWAYNRYLKKGRKY